jgi:hypothetical protein
MGQQGYSQMNRGYDEQPGINWGKVGLYGLGAAAGYGVLRAGAIKGKKMLGPHFQNGKAIGGGILGMQMRGGWRGYADLGASSIVGGEAEKLARAARTNEIRALGKESQAAVRAGKAAPAPTPARQKRSGRVVGRGRALGRGTREVVNPAFLGRERDIQHAAGMALDARIAHSNHMAGVPGPRVNGNFLAGDVERHASMGVRLGEQRAAAEAYLGHQIDMQKGISSTLTMGPTKPKPVLRRRPQRMAAPIPKSSSEIAQPFVDRIRSLQQAPVNAGAYMEQAMSGSRFARGASAAAGFFGAMDYAGASGMKRFGVGAARVGLAAGAIGLGMKALNALNPFSD